MWSQARALPVRDQPVEDTVGTAAPWMYFRTTGSVEQLAAALNRLRAAGWQISEQPPVAGPFDMWDVLVRPPVPSPAQFSR